MKRFVVALAAAIMLVSFGCAPRVISPVIDPESSRRIDPGPLAEKLRAYNEEAHSVRVRGVVRAEGKGRADFIGLVGEGVRLDVTTRPFPSLLMSVACREGQSCLIYAPGAKTLYTEPTDRLNGWLSKLLRGRVPLIGEPIGGFENESGERVLVYGGVGGWYESVVFDGETNRPVRAVFSRAGEKPSLEVTLDKPLESAGWFPSSVELYSAVEEDGFELSFKSVVEISEENGLAYDLNVPVGTVSAEEFAPSGMKLLFWMPAAR